MKKHFIISYPGNKREEVEIITNNINLNVETICEPYCGSSAMSCYISTLYPLKYRYILNDNSTLLFELYNIMKDEAKLDLFIETINKICFDKDNKFINKEKYKELIKIKDVNGWFIANKYYNMVVGLYPLTNNIKPLDKNDIDKLPIIKFLRTENITISNIDAIEIIKNNNNMRTLILCDPPYISVENKGFYENHNMNIYQWIFNNKNLLVNSYFILENCWIIKLLFNGFETIEYNKVYNGVKKKKVKHCIIKVSNN